VTTPLNPTRLAPLYHQATPVNPSLAGLYGVVDWVPGDDDGADRHLNGVEIKGPNYGGDNAFGVWEPAYYCSEPVPGQIKTGERPDILDPFDPITVWGYDECDATVRSRTEILERARQLVRLEEQQAVELEVANRILTDVGAPAVRPNLKEAVAYLEGEIAKTGTTGYIHIGAHLPALEAGLFVKSGTQRVTPTGGHIWVIGGGYVDGLGQTLVATSQPFGWRNEITVRPAYEHSNGIYAAIAERTVTIGYEAVIAAVTITP
jgi:hypothetical protein